jgi:hypothetical protein
MFYDGFNLVILAKIIIQIYNEKVNGGMAMKKINRIFSLLIVFGICISLNGCVTKKAAVQTSSSAAASADSTQSLNAQNSNVTKVDLSKMEAVLAQNPISSAYQTVALFEASISQNGEIQDFNLLLNGFDKDKNYDGNYQYDYHATENKLNYSRKKKEDLKEAAVYDENSDWANIKSEIKRLPLAEEIAKLNFKNYKIRFQPGTTLDNGTPIIDGSKGQNFAVLSFADYKNKKGGTSDGHTAVIIRLYDGVSVIDENNIYYQCKAANKTTVSSSRNGGLKLDYKLNPISFTRDYGETWIKADISAADLSETLKTYQSQYEIPNGSYYISEKPDGIIAFFYGGKPTLSITKDNGKTWQKKLFKFDYADIQKAITHRFVGFTSDTEGYVGLGTDWSMGTGQSEFCYLTHDGGATWENKKLPRTATSMLLDGMAFCDSKCGVVTYNKAYSLDKVMPDFYYTNNGGNSWAEFTVPSNKSIADFSFQEAESLVFANGTYTLTLGQTGRGNKKVSFTSTNLKNWTFQKMWTAVVHSIG